MSTLDSLPMRSKFSASHSPARSRPARALPSHLRFRVALWLGLRDLGDICDLRGENLVDEKRTRFLKHLIEFRSFHAHENATEITQPYSRRFHYVAAADCAVVCSMK